jgi:hypothetical protein
MKNTTLLACAAAMVFAVSCSRSAESNSAYDFAKHEREPTPAPSQTDVTKMLREANLKFRVKSVKDATSILEKMAVGHGGYVAQSMYDIEESENIIRKMTTDSAEEVKKLYQRNHMEVFVLNTRLDSFLDGLNRLVDHLEFRHITAYDVELEGAQSAVANAENGAFHNKTEGANESMKVTANANSFVAAPTPKDTRLRKKYARVTMDIYQTPVVKKWTIPNPDSFEVARGGFFDDFGASFRAGWRGTTIFFNYLVSFWPVWLLASVVVVWWKRRRKGLTLLSVFKKSTVKS